MAVSKVTLKEGLETKTLIDLTQDTVVEDKVVRGYKFHRKDGVTSEGTLDLPSGTMNVTNNGVYNVTNFAEVDVQVEDIPAVLTTKYITQNNTYYAQNDGAEGYSSVEVNVQPDLYSLYATDNNSTYIASDYGYDGFNQVTVNVPSSGSNSKLIEVVDRSVSTISDSDLNLCTQIGTYAFGNCYNLQSIVIPSTVYALMSNAFINCQSLEEITFNTNSINMSSSGVFYNCELLNTINYCDTILFWNNNMDRYHNMWDSDLWQPITIHCSDGDIEYNTPVGGMSVTYINSSSQSDIQSLNTFHKLDQWRYNLSYPLSEISSLILPEGVQYIDRMCFSDCTSLTSITLPSSLLKIGSSPFSNCHNLSTIHYSGTVSQWRALDSSDNLFEDAYNLNQEIILYCSDGQYSYNSPVGNMTITYSDTSTQSISVNKKVALSNYSLNQAKSDITDIQLPEGVETLDNFAFNGCTSLTTISLPQSLLNIYNYVFENCVNLTSITLPSNLQQLYPECLSGCGITSLYIPASVTYIQGFTCPNLQSITVDPNNVNYFSQDGVLLRINGELCIYPAAKLTTNYTTPISTTYIWGRAFKNASNLVNVTLTSNITTLESEVFEGCVNLTSFTCEAIIPPQIGYDIFDSNSTFPIYVPAESVSDYQTSGNWAQYASRITAIV